jgi:hypothetical protein
MCSIVYIYGAFGPVESSWDNNRNRIDALLFVLRALITTKIMHGVRISRTFYIGESTAATHRYNNMFTKDRIRIHGRGDSGTAGDSNPYVIYSYISPFLPGMC